MSQLLLPLRPHPPGFTFYEDVIGPAEEADLVAFADTLEMRPFVMRGTPSLRRVAAFGADYGVGGGAPPMPPILAALRDRACARAALDPAGFVHALVTVYPPGAGIGWHRDYSEYGAVVLGVSLGAPARLRLRRADDHCDERVAELPPRSLYVLGGEARTTWEHAIPSVPGRRVSVTFRTLA